MRTSSTVSSTGTSSTGTRADAALVVAGREVRLLSVGERAWRVLDARGRVWGNLDARDVNGSRRYRAKRFRAGSGGFVAVGEFWSPVDAVAALRG
ncbi:hypothetical protein [Microbacterium sp.]|uniref:hypothetical protein n=1 Tax=Microbacterium sp. TaxID=51671 RepID=UPI003A863A08